MSQKLFTNRIFCAILIYTDFFGKMCIFFAENPYNYLISILLPSLAQLDRVSDSDSEGCRFDSCRTGRKKRTEFQYAFFSDINS